ncbi:hypothetical protein PVK06_004206 [Gossypium arboreum]|uniref:Uncharacterized protein n=1 Tax=Gossypium arboreum TaxID=29729 RepID=A0ABR0QSN7_GOSAR|nr:hypothetical protein PVK06_004206 [Gossypium arboreum]
MGTGAQSGQEMNSLRLKSLRKRSKNDAGFNGSMVGSHSKTSPISLGQHVCLTDDGNFVNGVDSNLQAKNLDEIKAHFNPAFEGPVEVAVQLTDNILDQGKHSVVIFKKISNSPNQSKGRIIESMSAGSAGTQVQKFNGKFGVAKGERKNSNVLRGRGSRFKASANVGSL